MHVTITLDPENFALAMTGPAKIERIRIDGAYPRTARARWLFAQAGLMHLVAPYFPKHISTDFPVPVQTRELIRRMYRFEGASVPHFSGPTSPQGAFPKLACSPRRVVVEYSGGKDSMDNLARAHERYGVSSVLAVHISGLAKGVAAGELRASIDQSKRFGFPLRIIELRKSSGEKGAAVLRSAKIFDAALVMPYALEFNASRIITEEPGGGPYFTGNHAEMQFFNERFLRASGIPVRVAWWNRPKDGVVRNLIRLRPDWLPHVHNCFSPAHYKIGIRKSWLRRTPSFPPFKHACGSCVKCRLTRLGWLLYGNHQATKRDATYFIRDTEQWVIHKRSTHQDLIGGSLTLYLERARRRYGLAPRFVA